MYVLLLAVVSYAVGLLVHVQEAHDLGVHCLFSDPSGPRFGALEGAGSRISWVDADIDVVGPMPREGDRLQRVAGEPVPSFLHFQRRVSEIAKSNRRTTTVESALGVGGVAPVQERFELLELLTHRAPPGTVSLGENCWVRVEFDRESPQGLSRHLSTWLRLKPIPNRFVVLSLAWFLLEMIVFAIGAVVYINRPYDRSARVFLALCATSIVTFMGAFHWPDLVGTRVLVYPFVLCALLLPPITLHFYLLFPRPWFTLRRWPRSTLVGMYALPVIWIALTFVVLVQAGRSYETDAAQVTKWLDTLRGLIYSYLVIGVAMFAVGQGVLIHAYVHSRTASQGRQVRGVLVAVALAGFLLIYLLYTALTNRAEFAFGTTTRLVLYMTSVLFTLAYAVSMTRYKLLQLGELVHRGVFYVTISLAATAIFCLLVGIGTELVGKYAFRLENALAAGLTAMLVVVVLGWVLRRFQRALDRRFARDRYQLDKAMRQLGEAVDELVSPVQVAQSWLLSACDAVGAKRGLVYLRRDPTRPFELAARTRWPAAPELVEADSVMAEELREHQVLSSRAGMGMPTTGQLELRELEGDIGVGLELEGELLGIGILDTKPVGTYTLDDKNFLAALARTAAVALRGADSQQTIESLKEQLQQQVDKIAEQQQRIRYLQTELLGSHQAGTTRSEATGERKTPDPPVVATKIRGSSPAIRHMLNEAAKIARSSASVLIRGESGTGKELLAHTIHENSLRAVRPFVAMHCAALSANLLESELFGHVQGAFTGADRDRVGRFEKANGGTLLLDEIGDISLETQTKLLRVLQERAFERVGSVETIQVDVRLIAATHQNLEALIRQGRFREDLYYRLNVISIVCPPLRERRGDIFELALYFLRHYAARSGKTIVRLEDEAAEALKVYDWPGNVRELENAIERAVVLTEGDAVGLDVLPAEIARQATSPSRKSPAVSPIRPLEPVLAGGENFHRIVDELADVERSRLVSALKQAGGNKSQAARILGMPRSTLFSKLRRLDIE